MNAQRRPPDQKRIGAHFTEALLYIMALNCLVGCGADAKKSPSDPGANNKIDAASESEPASPRSPAAPGSGEPDARLAATPGSPAPDASPPRSSDAGVPTTDATRASTPPGPGTNTPPGPPVSVGSVPFPYKGDVAKGEGWNEFSTPLLMSLKTKYPNEAAGSYFVTCLTIAPNGDLIMATRFGVMRSLDQGQSWTRIDGEGRTRPSWDTGYPETSGSVQVDPEDSNRIAFLWFRGSSYYTNGSVWRRLTKPGGTPNFDFASLDWSSPDPQLFVGPIHGTWRLDITRDAGATWESQDNRLTGTGEAGPSSDNSMVVVVDANTVLYHNKSSGAIRPSGLFRSEDQGRTWVKVLDGMDDVGKGAVALRDGRVYFAASRALWSSRDRGLTWTKVSAPLASQGPFMLGDWRQGKTGGMVVKSPESVSYSVDEGRTWRAVVGGASGVAFPPSTNGKAEGLPYSVKNSEGLYSADNLDYRRGPGIWAYDPVHNVVYASSGFWGGPVLSKKLAP